MELGQVNHAHAHDEEEDEVKDRPRELELVPHTPTMTRGARRTGVESWSW